MKRYLLLAVIFSSPAHAQLSVTDIGTHVIGQLGLTNQATEIAKWGQQLQAMQQQYQQLQATYNVLSHVTDINGVSSILGGVTRSYMPASSSVPGLMGGTGGLWSSAGALLHQDRLFQSSNNDPYQQEMQRHEEVTANAKAMAAAGIQDAQQSITNLAALKARLEAAQDITEVTAVNGYIALEQQRLDANRAQLENVKTLLAADDRVSQQRQDQIRRQSAESLTSNTRPVSDVLR